MNSVSRSISWQPKSLWAFAQDIKISHSIFALPFMFVSLLLLPKIELTGGTIFLLLGCMVSARTFAMGMNRVLDRQFDLLNPRTQNRALPAARVSAAQALMWCFLAATIFIFLAFQFNMVTGFLSVPLLGVLALYSLMKRWTWFTHWYLGICLGLAPIGAAVALTGSVPATVIMLSLAVALWVAGFDLLYALQDMQFDRLHKLRSIPAKFGENVTVLLSGLCFVAMVTLLSLLGNTVQAGPWFFAGVIVVALILTLEHVIVYLSRQDALSPARQRQIMWAFFNGNAMVSVIFYLFAQLDIWITGPWLP